MNPYKIFIIDDEPMIIKGLQQLVPWEEIHCEISGTAKNGEEGLLAIQKNPCDIVISDIRMPKLSGLEMIEALRKVNDTMKFIILTGHRDFEYAQKAIRLGATQYLLKPTNIEDIKSAVIEAMMQLDEERAKEEDIRALRESVEALRVSKVEEEEPEQEQEPEKKMTYLAAKAIEFMKEHYQEKLDLQKVADHLFISTWYLCKVLKREVNNSFVQLLNEIRIQEAKKLLHDSNYKVYEICEMVGYTDTPYFTKAFKNHTGMTPNQYRNDYQSSSEIE